MPAGSPLPFRLPSEVTVTRDSVSDGVAYVFRHRRLGLLGRLVATDYPGQQTLLNAEVAGDESDPMPPRLPATPVRVAGPTTHRIPAQLLQCRRCNAAVGHLIFVEDASLTLDDHARLMYQRIQDLRLPTWIIGPPPGPGGPTDLPAEVLKVFPVREPPQRLSPEVFRALIDPLTDQHCQPAPYSSASPTPPVSRRRK
jgi:hypothetical protein